MSTNSNVLPTFEEGAMVQMAQRKEIYFALFLDYAFLPYTFYLEDPP